MWSEWKDDKGLNPLWLLNSGASHHITRNLEYLQSVYKVTPSLVVLSDGTQTVAEQEGTVILEWGIVLKRVLYVPSLNRNIISLSKLIKDSNCFVIFTNEFCVIHDRNSRILIGVGELRDRIYYYHSLASVKAYHVSKSHDLDLLHQRMGHLSLI